MATEDQTDDALTEWYSTRIGKPETSDEARGYLVFVLGVILGIVGVGLLVSNDLEGPVPQWPVVLAAAALIFLIAGPLIRLPLRRMATILVYVGALLGLAALPWFVSAYPGWRSDASTIIGLYSLGLLVMAIGGVFVPILSSGAERDEELERQRAEISGQREQLTELQAALDDAEADEEELSRLIDQVRAEQVDTAADEADLAARLEVLRDSQARFELYQDKGDQWRWRLRHRNGNVIADGGEGYTRKHNAQKGMQSVRRNALGATVMHIEKEAELPEEDEEFEPVEEQESQATFEVSEDAGGEYRWSLRHDNGNIIADGGEGYSSKSNAQRALGRIREYVGPADYLRFDPVGFEVYRDAAEEWRWRLVHRNGNILADSGEGYTRRNDARRAADRLRERIDDFEFEVYEDQGDEYRWRLRGSNDRIVADSGEGYSSKSSAEDAVDRVQEYAPEGRILDIGRAAFEVFEDASGEFRWRLRHRNGNILADSGEGYTERNKAYDAIESVKRNAPNADETGA